MTYPLPVQDAPRLSRQWLGFAFMSLLAAWMLYAVPPARARAMAALSPWLGGETQVRFGEMRARRGALDGQTVLYVEGSLVADRAQKAPTLRVALIGDDGRAVYTWKAKLAKPKLEAGKETPFQTRLLAPPEAFKSIAVSVAEGG